jgi:hypothetical protein
MLLDGYLSGIPPPIPITTRTGIEPNAKMRREVLNGLDVYLGLSLSGSYMHTHGTSLASSSGSKIWILYSPEQQCKLATPFGARMLARAKLPPLCDETDPDPMSGSSKYHVDSSLCLGQLHPLEVFRKLIDIDEPARPIVVLTHPGDTLLLPERWMHMTVNLDASYTVSYRFERSMPYHLGCPDKIAATQHESSTFEL